MISLAGLFSLKYLPSPSHLGSSVGDHLESHVFSGQGGEGGGYPLLVSDRPAKCRAAPSKTSHVWLLSTRNEASPHLDTP